VRISAVVPVFDEEPALRELHGRLAATLALAAADFEVVYVDDGSRDRSMETLEAIAASDPRVVVVGLRRNFGKSAALAAGLAEASGEIVVTLDADLQDVPEEIPTLLARLAQGADLVTGRKHPRRDRWTRRLASRVFNVAASWLAGTRVRDVNSGFKAFRRQVALEVPLHGELHRFLPVLARARGFTTEEVDVRHDARRHGKSRYGWGRYLAGGLDPLTVLLLTRYGKRPFHFFGLFGAVLAIVGFAILAYLTVGWLLGRWIGDRPLLALGVLLLLLGAQTALFGLLAELIVVRDGGGDPGYGIRRVIRGAASLRAPASPPGGPPPPAGR